MPAAELPLNESARLARLREFIGPVTDAGLAAPEAEFFLDLVQVAATVMRVPVVAISVVESDKQVFTASVGLTIDSTPRDQSFCAHAILNPTQTLVVNDASADPRFADNPLVTGPTHVRFYVGAPLVLGDGTPIGTLCAIDHQPGKATPEQLDSLRALSRQVVQMFEARHRERQLREAELALRSERDYFNTAMLHSDSGLVEVSWRGEITWASDRALQILGVRRIGDRRYDDPGWQCVDLEGTPLAADKLPVSVVLRTGKPVRNFMHGIRKPDGTITVLRVNAGPMHDPSGKPLSVLCSVADVTEEVAAQRHFEETAKRLHLALAATQDGVWDWDLQTGMVTVSDRWHTMLGRPAMTLATLDLFRSLVHPQDLALVEQDLSDIFSHLRPALNREIRMRHVDGTWMWVLTRGQIVQWSRDGAPLRMVGTHVDIHARKIAEQAQRASDERLARIASQITTGMVYQFKRRPDGTSSLPYASEGIRKIYGVSPDEVRDDATILLSQIHPDDAAEVMESVHASERTMQPWRADFRNIGRDGVTRWLSGSAMPQPDPDEPGAILWHGFIKDITDRKVQELELVQQKKLLEIFIERTPAAVAMFDLDMRYIAVSRRWQAEAPASFGSLIGKLHYDVFPFLNDDWRAIHRRCLAGATEMRDCDRFVHPDGRVDFVRWEVTPWRRADGTIGGVIIFTQTITEQVRQQEVLAQNARELKRNAEALEQTARDLAAARDAADAASRAKSQFLANISHEIRTPMTAILGFADMLADPGLSRSTALDHVSTIKRNGEHLLSVLNDVLDLSKIEADRMIVESIDVSPCAIVHDVVAMFSGTASAKDIRLSGRSASASLPRTIRSDPTRLRQVLLNLVGNAVKFTEKGSVDIELFGDRAAQRLEFRVIDTGIGIAEHQIESLFTPFHQADATTTRRFGGTGLGLTISRRLAELLGGSLSVRSREGAGSTFTVALDLSGQPIDWASWESLCQSDGHSIDAAPQLDPLLHNGNSQIAPFNGTHDRPAASGVTPLTGQLLGMHVLYADDGTDNRRLVQFLLGRAGAIVSLAENGREAVEMAARESFDVILMDLHMPVLDGEGAIRAIRAAGNHVPIVAVTAEAMHGDRERCLAMGCADYASKPINPSVLVAALKRATDGAQAR